MSGTRAVVATSLLAYALSPGLRADHGDFVVLLSGVYAIGVKDFVLSFGVFSPIAFSFAIVVQVFVAATPSAPVSLADSLAFGVWEGLAMSLAGSVDRSVLAFPAVRRWDEPGPGSRHVTGTTTLADWVPTQRGRDPVGETRGREREEHCHVRPALDG